MRHLTVLLVVVAFVCGSWMGIAEAKTCSPGDKAKVQWKNSWYPATVLKAKGNKCFIHYDGYNSSWDEWVAPRRIKLTGASSNPYPTGTAVQVKWKQKWWPARVLAAKSNSWKIHYDGYNSSWDEWVGPSRIKK